MNYPIMNWEIPDDIRIIPVAKKQPYSSGNQKIRHGDDNRKRKRKHGKH